jgi:hypothetical protein
MECQKPVGWEHAQLPTDSPQSLQLKMGELLYLSVYAISLNGKSLK